MMHVTNFKYIISKVNSCKKCSTAQYRSTGRYRRAVSQRSTIPQHYAIPQGSIAALHNTSALGNTAGQHRSTAQYRRAVSQHCTIPEHWMASFAYVSPATHGWWMLMSIHGRWSSHVLWGSAEIFASKTNNRLLSSSYSKASVEYINSLLETTAMSGYHCIDRHKQTVVTGNKDEVLFSTRSITFRVLSMYVDFEKNKEVRNITLTVRSNDKETIIQ